MYTVHTQYGIHTTANTVTECLWIIQNLTAMGEVAWFTHN